MNSVPLYDILKNGYGNDKKKQAEFAQKYSYVLDQELSNNNHQIYYNKNEKKLIHNINGTQNKEVKKSLYDWGNNLLIGLGHGKYTPRYSEEYQTHKKARDKYKDITSDNIIGHSQAGWHTSELLNHFHDAKGITFNRATPILGNINNNKNETKIKTKWDPISLRDINFSKTLQVPADNKYLVDAHNIENLKDEKINV
jgi:hypothetical protein